MKISINVEGNLFQDVFLCFAPFVAISPVCLVSEYRERGIKKRLQKRVDIELGFELCKPDDSRDIGALVCRGFFLFDAKMQYLVEEVFIKFSSASTNCYCIKAKGLVQWPLASK